MPIARNLAASGGRSSNPRERANQYQGPPSSIAVVKTAAVVVGHVPASLNLCFSNSFQEHSTRPQWKSGAGYGMEVPCTYRLYGPIERLKKESNLSS